MNTGLLLGCAMIGLGGLMAGAALMAALARSYIRKIRKSRP